MKRSHKKTTDHMTDTWLRQNGINPDNFSQIDILLLQALRAAFHTLKNFGDMLNHNQTVTLNVFRLAMANKSQRSRLKDSDAYAVLNIATAIRRKFFKRRRLIKQNRHSIKASGKYRYSND